MTLRRAALVAALATLGAAAPAHAFVRYKTSMGKDFAWKQSCIPLTYYPSSMIDAAGAMDMTPEQIDKAVQASAAAWSSGANDCSFLVINAESSVKAAPSAVYDKRNSLIFQTRNWCGPKTKTGACSYDSLALAITSVFVVQSDGTIRDADIEINGANFIWADLDSEPANSGKQDLQNALTHEMGHMIGLDHTCYMPGDTAPRAVDQNGNPVPDCPTAPAAVRATTMFASADPGDIQKRTLEADDKAAICAIYPVASDPMTCPTALEPGGSGGCGCAVGGGSGGAGIALAAVAGLVARARRRRKAVGQA
jgi:MYXO-CTERM domain-containing protein